MMNDPLRGPIVLFSGGLDSTVALYQAATKWPKDSITAMTFDYGQRNSHELIQARRICEQGGFRQLEVKLDGFRKTSSLLDPTAEVQKFTTLDDFMTAPSFNRSGFLPSRNMVFLSVACSYIDWDWYAAEDAGEGRDVELVVGFHGNDRMYDCSDRFCTYFAEALSIGLFDKVGYVVIHNLFDDMTKADVLRLATQLPGCLDAVKLTYSCYEAGPEPCGVCGECVVRKEAFKSLGLTEAA